MRYELGLCISPCFEEFDHKSMKTTLLSPEAAPDQQLEFHRGAEDGVAQETGDGLEA